MKKLLALLAVVLAVVSCQKEINGLPVDSNNEAAVSLSVALPDDATRAAGADSAKGGVSNVNLSDDDNSGYDIRFILEVYDENGVLAKERMVNYTDETETSFQLRLVPGRAYNFVVWADFVKSGAQGQKDEADLYYDTNVNNGGLRNVQVIDDKWDAIIEARDAYTDVFTVHNFSSTSTINMTLTRPFAKLRVVTNDIKEMISIRPAEVKVNYINTKFYDTFDAFTEEAKNLVYAPANLTATLLDAQKNPVDVYSQEDPNETGEQTLFADYFFGAEDDRVMFTFDVKDNGGRDLPQVTFNTNIPVKRNNLTTVYGPILTDANNVTVTINPAFENQLNPNDPPYYVEIFSGNMSESIELTKSGSYIFEDLTVNADQAVVVKNGADVVIDIKGYAKLNGKQGIVVEDGATLTINGISKTRTEERAGNLVVVATEGSAIGGKFITINNLAALTAKAGDVNCAYGIGAIDAEVTINNTKIDYVSGAFVQPLFVNDTKYGKSEPEGASAIGGKKVVLNDVELVKAEGGSKAAAIGNRYWQNTEVIITNCVFDDVFGGNASAAIGGSRYSSDISAENKQTVKIKIEDSEIKNAVGGQFGAGIGSGYDTHCVANDTNAVNHIEIINSNITAQGGKYAAGIGTGFHSAALTGSIDAASVINATSGEKFYKDKYTVAQNIGYGIVDPAREYKDQVVTFTVAGNVISSPSLPVVGENGTIVEGLGKDIENENQYYASEPEALTYIAAQVNSGNNYFAGKTIKLGADIDLNNEEWTPIGSATAEHGFMGNFDGNGKIIKNLNIANITPDADGNVYAGLFGVTEGVDANNENYIKNLTIENVTINTDGHIVAAAVAYPYYTNLENITVKGNVNIKGGKYTAGVLAYTRRCVNAKNIAINAAAGSVIEGTYTIGGVISDIQTNGGLKANYSNFEATGLTIKATMRVGGISGIIGKQTLNGATVKNVVIESDDARTGTLCGSFGGVCEITNAVVENVTGADFFIGGLYEGTESTTDSVTINGVTYTYNNGWLVDGYKVLADGLLKKDNEYKVTNAAGLVALSGMTINGKEIVTLGADIDLTGVTFNGLNAFNPEQNNTFDGNGYTVSNWTNNSGASDMGFIKNWVGPIKNVKFDNCRLKTSGRSAIVAAKVYGNIENVEVKNSSIEDSYWACGIIAGLYNNGNISNCTVMDSSVKSNGGTAAIVGVINETSGERKLTNCSVTGCTINNTGAYGASYSGGALVGKFNAGDARYSIVNCTVSNNTLVGDHVYEKYPANENVIEE